MTALDRWHHKLHEIPRAGIARRREAGEDLREAVAADLGVVACEALAVDYRLSSSGRDRYELTGRVTARFERRCVVTLEPMFEDIDQPIDCAFVPPTNMPGPQPAEEEALAAEEVEPIENDRLDVGRIVYETLAASLDPYPRLPGASLEVIEDDPAAEAAANHPFAALKQLAAKSTDET